MSDGLSDYVRSVSTHCKQCGARSAQECADGGQCEHFNGSADKPAYMLPPVPGPQPPEQPEHPDDRVGKWLSNALDDPNVCEEMKADVRAWFDSKTPPAELFPGNRKEYPVFTGLLMYFPNACAAVARCSHVMNEQHNRGEPVHWDKSKSIGTGDETVRHLMDSAYGTPPQVVDGREVEHAANHAWRALEYLERLILAKRADDGKTRS